MNKMLSMSAIALAVALSGCSDDDDSTPTTETPPETQNTPAVLAGDLTGAATKETSDAVTGTVTITDPDSGEAAVVAQTDVAATYGTFSIAADGMWTYTLDTSNSTIASLANEQDTVVETINIASVDGVVRQIEITIAGVPADQIAKIYDEDTSDTGELYYVFENGLTTGKISLSILYDALETQTAYISLYDAEGSTKTVIGELALDEGKFGLRENTFNDNANPVKDNSASSSINYDPAGFDAPDFTPGEWVDVELTWDTSSTTDVGTYSIMIDGTSYGPYTSQHPTPGVLVESMTVRLSSNGSESTDAVYVNDLNIYSDTAGTTAVFQDNFDDNYTAGDSLEDDNDDSPYGSRTDQAKVVVYGQDDTDPGQGSTTNTEVFVSSAADVTPGTTGNKIASIVDTTSSDAGELRLKLASDNTIAKGKLMASFAKTDAASCTVGSSVKDAYIGVHGTPSSTYEAIVDLRIDGTDYPTDFAIRKNNVSGDKTVDIDTSVVAFTADTWTEVEISWDATVADTSTNPLVSISIDGTSVGDAWNSYSEAVGGLSDGARYFTFRLGDSGAQMDNCVFKVDNIKVYATYDSDVDTLLFSENFEDYADGFDLETATDAAGELLYNSATQEATVATEQ